MAEHNPLQLEERTILQTYVMKAIRHEFIGVLKMIQDSKEVGFEFICPVTVRFMNVNSHVISDYPNPRHFR